MIRAAALFVIVASGCSFGRQHGPQHWRELRRIDPSFVAPRVARDGSYDAATCANICAYSGATVERCYPAEFVVPTPRQRILRCGYVYRTERRPVPRAEVDPAKIDDRGYVDRATCDRLCESLDQALTGCEVEPEPRAPSGDAAYVVCAIHMPGGSDLVAR